MTLKHALSAIFGTACLLPGLAHATNGMNLEGYGPVARGMGGAAMAHNNGVAGLMNNPATMSLMEDGQRLDMCVSFLGPEVKSSVSPAPGVTMTDKSGGDAYWMPALGWVKKQGRLGYGLGLFAQGGMGTEYDSVPLGLGSGEVRSEVSVGRFSIPVSYQVNEQLGVGATLDYLWAGMDLKMAMSGDMLGSMVAAGMGMPVPAPGIASGSMTSAMQQYQINPNWARFDFSNNSDFTGEAKGSGLGAKLGLVYKLNPQLTLGMSYHLQSRMSDLETDNASITMDTNSAMGVVPIKGKMTVKDFEWPSIWAIGLAYQASDKLLIAADLKQIRWADVMDKFSMRFVAHALPENGAFAGQTLDAELSQQWENQNVLSLGAAYQLTPAWTLRAGVNLAKNPIPDSTLNYLFPATIKNHYSVGVGYQFNPAHEANFAFVYAPEVTRAAASGVTTSHSQINWCVAYSYRF